MHLKWAFSEAASLFLKNYLRAQAYLRKLAGKAGKHGKSKGLSILAAKLGRTDYFLLSKERVFEMDRFFGAKHLKDGKNRGREERRGVSQPSNWASPVRDKGSSPR